jgi:hypothetical protein
VKIILRKLARILMKLYYCGFTSATRKKNLEGAIKFWIRMTQGVIEKKHILFFFRLRSDLPSRYLCRVQ